MQNKLKKTYKFAFKTALYITVFLALLSSVFLYVLQSIDILYLLSFAIFTYIISFIVIQYRVERFIYRRVKKIYDDLTLLESASLR
jgi:two-component system phosphate regulon sensor histidine kinase PhoR